MPQGHLAIAIALGACIASGQEKAQEPLSLCTVAANISAYAGQMVRLRALYSSGYEGSVLHDPECQAAYVWVEFNPKVSGKRKNLERVLRKTHAALVTLEGTMRGGEPMKIDPKLPDVIKEAFKNQKERYGHLGAFSMMIEVSRIVDAKPPNDAAPPTPAGPHR